MSCFLQKIMKLDQDKEFVLYKKFCNRDALASYVH